MANPQPDYDKLYQVQSWLTDGSSPMVAHLQKVMAPYEGKVSKQEYSQRGAQEMMKWLHSQFEGGKVPDAKAAQDFDYARRQQQMMADPQFKGTPEDADKTVRSGEPAYGNAYALIQTLQNLLPKQPPAAITMPAEPISGTAKPRPSQPHPVAPPRSGSLTDDEKLSDTQLRLLEGLSKAASGMNDNHTGSYDEADADTLDPASFLNAAVRKRTGN